MIKIEFDTLTISLPNGIDPKSGRFQHLRATLSISFGIFPARA
jgi:hypothetical protein